MFNREQVICSKYDIILSKSHVNSFKIKLNIKNKLNISDFINEDLYKLIASLNNDIIKKIDITDKISANEFNILYVFERFGSELGISEKYLFTKCIVKKEQDKIEFISWSIPYKKAIDAEEIICKSSSLVVNNLREKELKISYEFDMDINEDLPTYLDNIIGILMKKILYNLKTFIDNLNNNETIN